MTPRIASSPSRRMVSVIVGGSWGNIAGTRHSSSHRLPGHGDRCATVHPHSTAGRSSHMVNPDYPKMGKTGAVDRCVRFLRSPIRTDRVRPTESEGHRRHDEHALDI